MKKMICVLLVVSMLAFLSAGCAQSRVIQGKEIEPYGLFNPDDKVDGIKYRVSIGNVFWSCVLVETVVAPVVLLGWFLYEPVGTK